MFVCIALIASLVVMGYAAKVDRSTIHWEYKVLENSWDATQMNDLGSQGWELVTVDSSRGDHVRAFFKRPTN